MQVSDRTAKSALKMIGGAVSFAMMATFVKWAAQTIHSNEVVFFRSILGSVMIGAIILKKGRSWIGQNPRILVLRGVLGFAALSMHFYAISELNLGMAVMLNYTAPIFVVLFARILLKERTRGKVKLAILLSFLGVYLLAGPHFEAKPFPILIGILSGICAALAYVSIRFNDEGESPYTIIFYFTTISTLCSFPFLRLGFHWPNPTEWIALLGVAVGAFFGQVWMTKSIQTAPVSFVLPFSYLTPVFCAVLGALIWKEYLSFQAMLGGAMIIVSGVAIYLFREKTPFIPLEE